MKSNKLLAKSITLGLILAMPYGVVSADEITIDSNYVNGKTITGTNAEDTIVYNGGDPLIVETKAGIKKAASLTVNQNLTNRGTIEDIGSLVTTGNLTNGTSKYNSTITVGSLKVYGNVVNCNKIAVTGSAEFNNLDNWGNTKSELHQGNFTADSIIATGYVNNDKGATITVTKDMTATGNITNSGTLTATNAVVKTDANFTNNGTAEAASITGKKVTNNVGGTVTVSGDVTVTGTTQNVTWDGQFKNFGTFKAENLNVQSSMINGDGTNKATLTVANINSVQNELYIKNEKGSEINVTGDMYGTLNNSGKVSVEGTLTVTGSSTRNSSLSSADENSSLTAGNVIVNGYTKINGVTDINTLTVNDTVEVNANGEKLALDIVNVNDNIQFRDATGDVELTTVNLNGDDASLQAGGTSIKIGSVNVDGNGAIEAWDWDNSTNDTAINVGTVTVNGKLSITNNGGENSSFKAGTITLKDGATLENKDRFATSIGGYTNAFDKFTVTTLTGTNSSIINEGNMDIGTLKGENNTIYLNELTEGISAYEHPSEGVAPISIGKNESTGLTLYGSSEITSTFDADNLWEGMQQLAHHVINKDTANSNGFTVIAEEDALIGRVTAQADENSHIYSLKEDTNITTAGIGELANVAFMAWRAENDEMHQRMGELRSSKGEAGIWARMKRGESKNGDLNIKNQYSTYQLGYDEKVGDSNWYLGGAISRTEGKSSFATGSGENQSTGFTVYGTYVADNGEYVDLSAKYARLDNEFDVFGRDGIESIGDYRNNGYAFSAEYGKRIETGNDFWVEPQVQLTYGHLSSANYTTSRGIKAAQDAMDSVVGRVGFAAGKDIGAGNVYVKASYLYDFDGETNVTMRNDAGASRTYEQDLGGGWFEFGIGTNINLSETSHLYFDVERAVGGDIDTPWQWNAGVRFDF